MTLYGKQPIQKRRFSQDKDAGKGQFRHGEQKPQYGQQQPQQQYRARGPPPQFQQMGAPQERQQGGYERREGFGGQREFSEHRRGFPPQIRPHAAFIGVFTNGREIFTKNLVPGIKVYGEQLLKSGEVEYRKWNPYRSKLGAVITQNAKNVPIRADSKVLYLGAASGTTVSHVSDIVKDGIVYAVEFSPRVFRELIEVSRLRKNVIPILADANHPELYSGIVGKADFVFQDIAQPNQTEIFIKNCKMFLQHGGQGTLILKARSVDVTIAPQEIFRMSQGELVRGGIDVIETVDINRFEIDHASFFVKMR